MGCMHDLPPPWWPWDWSGGGTPEGGVYSFHAIWNTYTPLPEEVIFWWSPNRFPVHSRLDIWDNIWPPCIQHATSHCFKQNSYKDMRKTEKEVSFFHGRHYIGDTCGQAGVPPPHLVLHSEFSLMVNVTPYFPRPWHHTSFLTEPSGCSFTIFKSVQPCCTRLLWGTACSCWLALSLDISPAIDGRLKLLGCLANFSIWVVCTISCWAELLANWCLLQRG